jgi:arginyl-tRNA synthetase
MVRDIAGAIQRFEKYKFDKMIYVVGDQQDLHCKRNRGYRRFCG